MGVGGRVGVGGWGGVSRWMHGWVAATVAGRVAKLLMRNLNGGCLQNEKCQVQVGVWVSRWVVGSVGPMGRRVGEEASG